MLLDKIILEEAERKKVLSKSRELISLNTKIIQLFDSCRIDFQSESLINCDYNNSNKIANLRRKHANDTNYKNYPISYQEFSSSLSSLDEAIQSNNENISLGIWNVSSKDINQSVSFLNEVVFTSSSSSFQEKDLHKLFIVTVDLISTFELIENTAKEPATKVNTVLESMEKYLKILTRLNCIPSTSTLHSNLANSKFGSCQENCKEPETNEEEKLQLIFAVILPPEPTTTFRKKQIHSLLNYYFTKISHEINCSLAFVNDMEGNEMNLQNFVSIQSLRQYIVQHLVLNSGELQSEELTLIHKPYSFDQEVIYGIMQRNASWEGHWDVSKDSLEDILKTFIPTAIHKEDKDSQEPALIDEQSWLRQLQLTIPVSKSTSMSDRSSLERDVNTTMTSRSRTKLLKDDSSVSSTRSSTRNKSKKKDIDVNSFFNNLRNKK